ncbi:MAG: DUF4363 family protein [Clostridia bacterium]|nr:DUF4363 family protein [Clostridia bacterium]
MKREIIVILIILIFIVSIDVVLGKKLDSNIDNLCDELIKLDETIDSEDTNLISEQYDKVDNLWTEYEKSFSYYLEHDELEKVGTELAVLESNIKSEQWDDVKSDISKLQFILEHLKEKIDLKLKNIF